jgi:hypothetical protein
MPACQELTSSWESYSISTHQLSIRYFFRDSYSFCRTNTDSGATASYKKNRQRRIPNLFQADYFFNKAGDFDKVGLLLRDFEMRTGESGSET